MDVNTAAIQHLLIDEQQMFTSLEVVVATSERGLLYATGVRGLHDPIMTCNRIEPEKENLYLHYNRVAGCRRFW